VTNIFGIIFRWSQTRMRCLKAFRKVVCSERLRAQSGKRCSMSQGARRNYYGMCIMTHRRHGTPPQTMRWFRNLAERMGEMFTIHLAYLNGRPIAGVVMLSFRKSLCYKYGASDPAHHNSGAVPFLFWEAIQEAKTRGC